jgi:ER degradation enhancer, mannosidase alpha-like 1
LNDKPRFEQAVRDVIGWVSFDVNTKPQVFEITIRVLGGLLSAHQFAIDSTHPFYLPWYKGELLDLAYDLGNRLLPAFNTPTGIPYARTNLRKGVAWLETTDTCAAAAGSLILEFATLSRLTGDDRFEKVAHKAFFAVWNRKSDVGLVSISLMHIFLSLFLDRLSGWKSN